jgi:hypothetical protein
MGHRRSGQLLQKRIHFASDLPFIRLENVVIGVCQPYLYLLASAWQTDDCTISANPLLLPGCPSFAKNPKSGIFMSAHLDECISDFSSTTPAEELVKPSGVPQLSMSDWGTLYFATSKTRTV